MGIRFAAGLFFFNQRSQKHHRLYVRSSLSRRDAETGSGFRKFGSSRETRRSGQSQHLAKQCFLETGGGKKRDSSGQDTRLLIISVIGWPVHTLELKGLLGKKIRKPARTCYLLRHGPFLVSYCIDHHLYLCKQASKSQGKVPQASLALPIPPVEKQEEGFWWLLSLSREPLPGDNNPSFLSEPGPTILNFVGPSRRPAGR